MEADMPCDALFIFLTVTDFSWAGIRKAKRNLLRVTSNRLSRNFPFLTNNKFNAEKYIFFRIIQDELR